MTLNKKARAKQARSLLNRGNGENEGIATSFVNMEEKTERERDIHATQIDKEKGGITTTFVKMDETVEKKSDAELEKENIQRFRRRAEEGFPVLQALTFFGGAGMVFSSMIGLEQGGAEKFSAIYAFLSFYSWIFGLFTIGLEGRVFLLDVFALHRFVSNYIKMFRFMLGRGLFYIFIGSLHLCLMSLYSIITGGFMMAIGLLTFIIGVFMSARLKTLLKKSKGNRNLAQNIFEFYDIDHDGYIDFEGFRDLLIGMGIKVKDVDAEFKKIDQNNDEFLSYLQVKDWVDTTMEDTNKTILDHLDIIGLYYSE